MEDANGLPTPMVTNTKPSKHEVDRFAKPSFYCSMCAIITCLEISYAINKMCQFLSHPLETHSKAMKCILGYLNRSLYYRMTLQLCPLCQALPIIAFSDAD
ncbi:hypothetical protein CR513_43388, partial [Mucuna pruriens]